MAESKKDNDGVETQKANKKTEEAWKKEVQEKVDQELEQGFSGTEVDPIPNEEYSLESGPDSPTVADGRRALAEREADLDESHRPY